MNNQSGFHTLKGYSLIENKTISYSMEDYLEMIARMLKTSQIVRINELAQKLQVRPSSASKMVMNLKEKGLVSFEKYGYISLTDNGREVSTYLLKRHSILNRFLCFINNSQDELEQVEKIEHFINRETISNIDRFLKKYEK